MGTAGHRRRRRAGSGRRAVHTVRGIRPTASHRGGRRRTDARHPCRARRAAVRLVRIARRPRRRRALTPTGLRRAPMRLGGLTWDDEPRGPVGHSDGDAAIHALIDALLGAARLGDVGTLFPPGETAWEGADSADLLQRAVVRLAEHGWRPAGVDLVVAAARPVIAARRDELTARLAGLLEVRPDAVSIREPPRMASASPGRRGSPPGRSPRSSGPNDRVDRRETSGGRGAGRGSRGASARSSPPAPGRRRSSAQSPMPHGASGCRSIASRPIR